MHSVEILCDSAYENERIITMKIVTSKPATDKLELCDFHHRTLPDTNRLTFEELIRLTKFYGYSPETETVRQYILFKEQRDCAIKAAKNIYEFYPERRFDIDPALEPYILHPQLVSVKCDRSILPNWINIGLDYGHHPDLIKVIGMMRRSMARSKPKVLKEGEWHLPFVTEQELADNDLIHCRNLSAERCASINYPMFNDMGREVDDKNHSNDYLYLFYDISNGRPHLPFRHIATPRVGAGFISLYDLMKEGEL